MVRLSRIQSALAPPYLVSEARVEGRKRAQEIIIYGQIDEDLGYEWYAGI